MLCRGGLGVSADDEEDEGEEEAEELVTADD